MHMLRIVNFIYVIALHLRCVVNGFCSSKKKYEKDKRYQQTNTNRNKKKEHYSFRLIGFKHLQRLSETAVGSYILESLQRNYYCALLRQIHGKLLESDGMPAQRSFF